MKALILAAGYATRLYPLTRDYPKPLLEIGGRTILDNLICQIEAIPQIDGIWLVTNHRFVPCFSEWLARTSLRVPIELLDDGSTTNENRLGALGDIAFALARRGQVRDDLLICAADNLFRFCLADFTSAFLVRRAPMICVRHLENLAARQRTGIVVLDEQDRVLEFAEKPAEPKTCWAVPPIYIYPPVCLAQLASYLGEGGSPDAPGHFVAWLCRREAVFSHRINGTVLDIGTPEALEYARKLMDSESGSSAAKS